MQSLLFYADCPIIFIITFGIVDVSKLLIVIKKNRNAHKLCHVVHSTPDGVGFYNAKGLLLASLRFN